MMQGSVPPNRLSLGHFWHTGEHLEQLKASERVPMSIPHICHFSPPIQFLAQFFSTQKRVNRDKTDYAKNSVNCHKTDFTTKNRVNFRFLHICHVQNFEIPPNLAKFLISPHLLCEKSEIPLHVEKFQISPHLSCIEI